MWDGGIDNTSGSSIKSLLDRNEFQISDAVKAALRLEVKQWVVNFIPQAKNNAIDFEVSCLMGLALYRFESAINDFGKIRPISNLTGDNCPQC